MLRSTEMRTWQAVGNALPTLPRWAASGQLLTWALAINPVAGGTSPYTAGTNRYLTWKSEGIRAGNVPTLWAARMSADGRSLAGPAVEL
ncbi:hypothetical protein [Frankia sp. ACN1ag]|uniref:hypothetical protein n=1 Tax=Frankia sp. ACN1ag TaxID=102891 RepID=UPI0006DC5934|nr:hypothetical protein [Frankia sp. ACN1ag]KQC34761.1 hypothetical protein UK82_30325 [Frankia sp. ACN1ag]